MSLESHAKYELARAGLFDKDSDYGGMIAESVLDLIKLFASQGHSGGSAQCVIKLFDTLVKFNNLSPLTGEDSEWNDVSDISGEYMLQNKRNSAVFKSSKGTYYLDGKLIVQPDGSAYHEKVSIKFPYIPSTQIVYFDHYGNEISEKEYREDYNNANQDSV